jgi:hypothetical protein
MGTTVRTPTRIALYVLSDIRERVRQLKKTTGQHPTTFRTPALHPRSPGSIRATSYSLPIPSQLFPEGVPLIQIPRTNSG